jgi:hypothetical protein
LLAATVQAMKAANNTTTEVKERMKMTTSMN